MDQLTAYDDNIDVREPVKINPSQVESDYLKYLMFVFKVDHTLVSDLETKSQSQIIVLKMSDLKSKPLLLQNRLAILRDCCPSHHAIVIIDHEVDNCSEDQETVLKAT